MTTLDRRRDYAEVWGAGGEFHYEQDGRQFRLDGQPREQAEPPVRVATKAPAAPKGKTAPKSAPKAAATAPKAEPSPDLVKLPDADLKTMVEIAGGEWTNRSAALAFLAEDK